MKNVSMNPFGIQILNGRKRKNFLKAMIYSTISKFNEWEHIVLKYLSYWRRRKNAEKVVVLQSLYEIHLNAFKKRKNGV